MHAQRRRPGPAYIRAGAQGQQGSSAARLPRGGARARRAGRKGVVARAELRCRRDAVHLEHLVARREDPCRRRDAPRHDLVHHQPLHITPGEQSQR
jgi:hypothetical protein